MPFDPARDFQVVSKFDPEKPFDTESDDKLDGLLTELSQTIKRSIKSQRYIPPKVDMDSEVRRRLPNLDDEISKRLPDFDVEVAKRIPDYEKLKKDILNNIPIPSAMPDISAIVRQEVSNIKLPERKIIERIIEKDDKKYADIKTIEALKKEIDALKKSLKEFQEILPMLGGSGVIGIPNADGQSGKYLSNDGNKPVWKTVTGGSGGQGYNDLGDPTVDGSWQIIIDGDNLSFQKMEGGSWVEKGAMLP